MKVSRVDNEELNKILEELKEAAENVGRELSENYRQRLVYNMLNAIKSGNQSEFLWILLRVINDPKNEKFRKLAARLKEAYALPPQAFERWGYAVVLGIMSARGE